jgi:O-acetyl-ADP-ribose deacetylase (regulator of RNase III)
MRLEIIEGDLLDQDVDVIVNAWNRNVIPWWLLLPQGVSGAIKKRGGLQPFREIGRTGPMALGEARLTSAGRLPFRGIIHVAGINLLWQGSRYATKESVQNAIKLVQTHGFKSIAFPLIGAGSGGRKKEVVQQWMQEALSALDYDGDVRIVIWRR